MYDSTPLKVPPHRGQNEILHETMLGKLNAMRRAPSPSYVRRPRVSAESNADRVLDVCTIWDDCLEKFAESLDLALSWGPFELVEVTPATIGADGKQRILSRFVYHGPLRDRDQFEYFLRESISQVAKIEYAAMLDDAVEEKTDGTVTR